MTSETETLDRLIQDQIAFIDSAIEKARKGVLADVTALARSVDIICARSGTLDEDSAQQLSGRMAEMIGKLEELVSELSAIQEREK